jgi:hypothetical protein
MNVRRGACEAQAIGPETQAPFSQSYFGGKDSRLARVAGVLVGMDCHYLNNPCPASFPYNGGSGEWAMARNRPKVLPEKLRLIREHLQLDHAHMTEQLVSEIESHTKQRIQIKPHWVPNFELGKHEPDLITVNSYSRLAKVSMNLIVDDDVSAKAFRKQLGKELKDKKKMVQHAKKRVKP